MFTSIDEIIRLEGGRVVATLCRMTGSLDAAEDAFAEAAVEAVRRWPVDGMPERPGAWLTTVARRKALDVLRRERSRVERERASAALQSPGEPDVHTVRDDQLRLIFMACHPALSADARVALTLRLLCGLTTAEIAAATFATEATAGKRITRAKEKLSANRVGFRLPPDDELPDRLTGVLSVIEIVFTTGHHAPLGAVLARVDLVDEGVRLAGLLVELMPDEPECHGLLALLVSTRARGATRVDESGFPVLLADADRSRWDHDAIASAVAMVERALRAGRVGPRQLRAAISCLHSVASSAQETDWQQIVQLYDMLAGLDPSPAVRVNRAVAVAEVDGPTAALASLDGIAGVDGWHLFHVVRADLLQRVGDVTAATQEFELALACPHNDADDRLMRARLAELRPLG